MAYTNSRGGGAVIEKSQRSFAYKGSEENQRLKTGKFAKQLRLAKSTPTACSSSAKLSNR